jgi:hypothetical protein
MYIIIPKKWLSKLTPRAIACAIPNLGTFLAQSGLKWSVRQILPPRYILAVFPSRPGSASSGAVVGYVIGICEEILKSAGFLRERKKQINDYNVKGLKLRISNKYGSVTALKQ